MAVRSMDVRLDGESLKPTGVDNSRPYTLKAVRGGALSGVADEESVTDRGFWVLLPGLAPGSHHLVINTQADVPGPSHVEWTLTAS
ncbi:hypothetical protein [Actinoallomurus rhizosphaericola]|uniref:hypothetical protein n=1 Tax=Actinoallomurus rhizosphaericola TaxID=2952536 RepID=UPI00209085A0|nr:hypothetical protein [Actinoallomurus rhizosphaericola]MCO5992496.1 hypothetical protein [Actinoallomurus rhizosphaericola]